MDAFRTFATRDVNRAAWFSTSNTASCALSVPSEGCHPCASGLLLLCEQVILLHVGIGEILQHEVIHIGGMAAFRPRELFPDRPELIHLASIPDAHRRVTGFPKHHTIASDEFVH